MTSCPIANDDPRLIALVASYEHFTGERLGTPAQLWTAPFVVLAHGTEDPPLFWYANQAAIRLWGYSFSEFVGMPSRQSVQADGREERERLLADVRERGISRSYTGVRIAKDGSRFHIENATIWNVLDARGERIGQAATFATWTPIG